MDGYCKLNIAHTNLIEQILTCIIKSDSAPPLFILVHSTNKSFYYTIGNHIYTNAKTF